MNIKEAMANKLIPKKAIEEMDVNPLRLIGEKYFEQPTGFGNYRDKAINEVIEQELSFSSDCNYICELINKLVTVTCPTCGSRLKSKNGGGNGHVWSATFKCQCGTEVSLTLPADGISVRFKEKSK